MTDQPSEAEPRRRLTWWLWRILAVIGVLLALAVAGFVIWGLNPLGPAPEATAAMSSDGTVAFSEDSVGLTFRPTGTKPTTGVIIYPGGHVDYRSYSTLARDLALAGYLAVVPPMPLSLAVLAPNRAEEVIAAHPEVEQWVIAGHSLGGSMACAYIDSHPGKVDALALLASYPASGNDLRGDDLAAVSLLGTRDTVVNQASWDAGKALLPASTTYTMIEGGNHAQFGSYGEQPGDTPATIPAARQRAQTVVAIENLLAP